MTYIKYTFGAGCLGGFPGGVVVKKKIHLPK